MDSADEGLMHFAVSENLSQIMSHLNLNDLQACSLVCKEWKTTSELVQNRRQLPRFAELQFLQKKTTFDKYLKVDHGYINDSEDDSEEEYFYEYNQTIYPEQHLLNHLQFRPKISLIFYDDTIHGDDYQRSNSQYIIFRYKRLIGSCGRKLFALSAKPCINYTQYNVCNNEIAGLFFPNNTTWASIQSEMQSHRLESEKKNLLNVLTSATPNESVFLFFNYLWKENNVDWMSVLQEIGSEIWKKNISCWGGCIYSTDSYDQVYPHEILLIKFGTKNMFTRTLMLEKDISKENFRDELNKFKNSIKQQLKSTNTVYFLTYSGEQDSETPNEEENNMDYIRIIRQTFSNSNVFSLCRFQDGKHNICFGFDYRSKNCNNFINDTFLSILLISYDND